MNKSSEGAAVWQARADARSWERTLLRNWVVWVTVGESIGFLLPTLVQYATSTFYPDAGMIALIIAGAGEGAILGWAQARVLRSERPRVSQKNWILGTAIAAAAAWAIGLTPSATVELWVGWPVPVTVLVGIVAGLLLLASIGFAQWFELRRHVRGSVWWIVGTAGGWLVALSVFFAVAMPLWVEGQPVALTILIGVIAGVLMAVTMALVTGFVMLWLLRGTGIGTAANALL